MERIDFSTEGAWLDGLLEAWKAVGGASIHARGDFKVALSGGSTPGSFYKALAKTEWPWEATKFFIGDERWVPIVHSQSNYRMIYESFYPHKIQLTRWKTELTKPEEAASDYERILKQELSSPPRFDLILLGIGDDGHTASLFPGTKGLPEEKRLTFSHYVPQVEASRLTITYPLIALAREVWFLARGEKKKPWVEKMATGADTSFPAAKVSSQGAVKIFYCETWSLSEKSVSHLNF